MDLGAEGGEGVGLEGVGEEVVGGVFKRWVGARKMNQRRWSAWACDRSPIEAILGSLWAPIARHAICGCHTWSLLLAIRGAQKARCYLSKDILLEICIFGWSTQINCT